MLSYVERESGLSWRGRGAYGDLPNRMSHHILVRKLKIIKIIIMAQGGHSATCTSGSDPFHFLKKISNAIKALPANVAKLFSQEKHDGQCVYCGRQVQDPAIQFCSQHCAALHWDHVREATAQTSRKKYLYRH